ncbi:hypothetical protein N431DRAFT_440922 [Stipitochalara longipes BDJ]|nr:hypothetical protein N431DRAFT_440922 [Stipitochalara longipes BDJ]
MSIHRDIPSGESTARTDSDPPPSYSTNAAYHLCPEEFRANERIAGIDSRRAASHLSGARPFTSTSEPSNILTSDSSNNIRQSTTSYRPSLSTSEPSENSFSIFSNCPISTYDPSDLGTKYSTSRAPSTIVASPSSHTVPTMSSTADDKTTEMAKKLISTNPELRNNVYSLLGSTIAAVEAAQPQDLKDRGAKIESLQKQLLDASNYGKEQALKVEKLEADLKVATDTGLSQVETLEDLHNQLKKSQQTEENIRKGNVAVLRQLDQLDPLKAENKVLRRKLKEAEMEIVNLAKRVDFQDQTLDLYSKQVRDTEMQAMRMQTDMRTLQRENHQLLVKGEQMRGELFAVAEQWHEPGAGAGAGMGGPRKRQAEEVLDGYLAHASWFGPGFEGQRNT